MMTATRDGRGGRGRSFFLCLVCAGMLLAVPDALARDASGKGSPVYGAGHTTPHGVKPGQGISGKPDNHGKGGTAHVPGPKGGHDDEEHSHDDTEGHDSGTSHVPGAGRPADKGPGAHSEGHTEDSGHDAGTH